MISHVKLHDHRSQVRERFQQRWRFRLLTNFIRRSSKEVPLPVVKLQHVADGDARSAFNAAFANNYRGPLRSLEYLRRLTKSCLEHWRQISFVGYSCIFSI